MRHWTGSSLVHVMACRPFGAKPLPKPMMTYFQLDPQKQSSIKFLSKSNHFHWKNCIWKYRLPKWRPSFPGLSVLRSTLTVASQGAGRSAWWQSTPWTDPRSGATMSRVMRSLRSGVYLHNIVLSPEAHRWRYNSVVFIDSGNSCSGVANHSNSFNSLTTEVGGSNW